MQIFKVFTNILKCVIESITQRKPSFANASSQPRLQILLIKVLTNQNASWRKEELIYPPNSRQRKGLDMNRPLKRICECSLFDLVSQSWSGLESHLKMIHKILENNNTLNMLLQLKVNDVRTSITSDPSFVPALERCEILFANGYLGIDSLALSPQVHYEHVFSYDFHPDDNYLTFLRRFLFSFLQCRYIRTSQEMSVPCNVVYQDYRRASLEQWGMSEVLPPFR